MKVRELIEKLKELPPDILVYKEYDGLMYEISNVEVCTTKHSSFNESTPPDETFVEINQY